MLIQSLIAISLGLVGISSKDASLNIYNLYINEVKIQAARSSTPRDFHKSIELVASKKIDLRPYVSKLVKFNELSEALEELNRAKGKMLRVVVKF